MPKPAPATDEVLIKVYATTVSRTDVGALRAQPPLIGRLMMGLFLYHRTRPGGPSDAKDSETFMAYLKDRIEAGQFRAVIDRTYSLDAIAEAYRYVETAQKTGIVVINVSSAEEGSYA